MILHPIRLFDRLLLVLLLLDYVLSFPLNLSGCNALWWLRCSYHSYRFKFILLSVLEFLGYMFLKHMCTYKAGLGGFVACRALSQRNNDPTKASRPWDSVSFNTFLSSLLGIVLETLYRVFANRKRVRCV